MNEMYMGEYIVGLDEKLNPIVEYGEIEQKKLGDGQGYPLPYLKTATYSGKITGRYHKVCPKKYEDTRKLEDLWYHGGDYPMVIARNDWDGWLNIRIDY